MTPSSSPPPVDAAPLHLRGFVLDLQRRELRTGAGDLAVLRPKALALLLALAEQAGHVVPKEVLVERIWPRVVVTDDSLTQLVNEIRRLLGDTTRELLRTVPRRGYLLQLPPAAAGTPPAGCAPASNLPLNPPALVGRERELAAGDDLLRRHRLVTLVGPGGIGKTLLALHLGWLALPRLVQGVWLVDLATQGDPSGVLTAIATATGIEPTHGDTLKRVLAELAGRDTLLVLDNCEHLVSAVSSLAESIIAATPRVRLLATSQVPLRAGGEVVQRLDVLSVPPPGADAATAMAHGAFRLLVQRVHDAGVEAELDPQATAAAVEICRRLEGVPLALEMAAARVPALGLAGVHAALDERLRLLRSARLHAPSRQETLRATLEWSCSLLSEPERRALRRLAVLCGPFEAELARALVAGDDLDEWAALDAFCGLVDKSLVRAESGAPVRYRLLETTRLLARERLDAAGETERTLDRHAALMAAYGPVVRRRFLTQPDEEIWQRCGLYGADLDAAFERCVARGDTDGAASILVALRSLDLLVGDSVSMERRLRAVHPLLPAARGQARAQLLSMFASCGWLTIGGLSPADAAEGAVAEWRALQSDPVSFAHCLFILATERAREGRPADADAALQEGLSITATCGHPLLRLIAGVHTAHVAMFCGEPARSLAALTGALELARAMRANRLACYIQAFLPGMAVMAGQTALAISLGSRAVGEMRSFGHGYLASAYESLVHALLQAGELERARAEAATSLPLAWGHGLSGEMATHVARYALRCGQPARAAVLLGFARQQIGPARNAFGVWRHHHCDALQHEIEPLIGAQALQDAALDAAARDPAAAFALAVRVLEAPAPEAGPAGAAHPSAPWTPGAAAG